MGRFELLASAIAGRSVTIERTQEKGGAWTDGESIFLDPDASETAVLQCVLVQAALLGAGSFEGEILDRLVRSTKLCRRYLFVEGHRALEALEAILPPSARRLSDPGIAALSTSPSHSLAIASGRQVFADPPEAFGMIRPRQIRRRIDAAGSDPAPPQYQPRSPARELLRDLDDEVEDPFEGPDLVSSPIGGGGAIGRLLKGLFRSRPSSKSGPPGADAPTHRSRRGTRVSAKHRAGTGHFAGVGIWRRVCTAWTHLSRMGCASRSLPAGLVHCHPGRFSSFGPCYVHFAERNGDSPIAFPPRRRTRTASSPASGDRHRPRRRRRVACADRCQARSPRRRCTSTWCGADVTSESWFCSTSRVRAASPALGAARCTNTNERLPRRSRSPWPNWAIASLSMRFDHRGALPCRSNG